MREWVVAFSWSGATFGHPHGPPSWPRGGRARSVEGMGRQALVLRTVATDSTFERRALGGGVSWVGKCLHCGRKIVVSLGGETAATIEHIVPRHHGGDDRETNVALACARCNQDKGRTLDLRRANDPRYLEAIDRLLERRLARLRDPATT